jgi:hypothetical protein
MQEVDEMSDKPLFLFIVLLAITCSVQAQDVPNAITYQGKTTVWLET